ncbi:MAG: cysteine hydrolase family protein [Proteocatella sp.]
MSKILIVVDMQNDFIDGALGTKEAESIVKNVVKKIQQYISNNENIYFTMDTHNENYLSSQEGIKLPVEHCIKGSKGWELQEDIKLLLENFSNKNKLIFEKNGFGSIELAETIKHNFQDNENTEIELIGLCTDICVITNAILLKTYMPNSKIMVDESCCAGVTVKSHNEALDTMKMCQIDINN